MGNNKDYKEVKEENNWEGKSDSSSTILISDYDQPYLEKHVSRKGKT